MEMREEVLYEIFLDLYKSYDALDHGRCLEILAAYILSPQDICLLWRYWDWLSMVQGPVVILVILSRESVA